METKKWFVLIGLVLVALALLFSCASQSSTVRDDGNGGGDCWGAEVNTSQRDGSGYSYCNPTHAALSPRTLPFRPADDQVDVRIESVTSVIVVGDDGAEGGNDGGGDENVRICPNGHPANPHVHQNGTVSYDCGLHNGDDQDQNGHDNGNHNGANGNPEHPEHPVHPETPASENQNNGNGNGRGSGSK